jgi:hypothetical protein
MGALETYRYKSSGKEAKEEAEDVRKEDEKEEETGKRRLRSGRLYKISVDKISGKSEAETEVAYWRKDKIYKRETTNEERPILIARTATVKEFLVEHDPTPTKEPFANSDREKARRNMQEAEERRYIRNKTSTFSSEVQGTIIVRMKRQQEEKPGSRVKFKEIIVHFY